MTKKKSTATRNNNTYSRITINPPGGIASITKPPKFDYVKHNPIGGIGSITMPNFIKRRRRAPDGHEILEIDYT